jgi:hypothetical protein
MFNRRFVALFSASSSSSVLTECCQSELTNDNNFGHNHDFGLHTLADPEGANIEYVDSDLYDIPRHLLHSSASSLSTDWTVIGYIPGQLRTAPYGCAISSRTLCLTLES